MLLESLNWQVDIAANGKEALALVQKLIPNIQQKCDEQILTDCEECKTVRAKHRKSISHNSSPSVSHCHNENTQCAQSVNDKQLSLHPSVTSVTPTENTTHRTQEAQHSAPHTQKSSNFISQYYQFILMDVEMPVMDGIQCAREMRRLGIHTPIVGLSGHGHLSNLNKVFDAYLIKPVNIEQLQRTFAELERRT